VAGLTRELSSTLFTVRWRPLLVALSVAAVTVGGCSKTPPTKDELLARANEDFAAQRYDKAEKTYRELLRLAPADPQAIRKLALIYYDQDQLPQAYELLNKAVELDPGDIETQLNFAETSLMVGDLKRAHEAALSVLDKRPGEEAALVALANATTPDDVEDTRTIIEDLRATKDQDRAGYHLALGALALRRPDVARAETKFEAAAKLDPKSAVAHTALGDLAWRRNEIKAADESFKTAAGLSPLRSPMRLRYADFKLRTGAPAEAKASKRSPRNTQITSRRGSYR
jgi:predicted Zn-dependent protease